MKGADHLVLVARELRRRGIAFTMDIYGDGDLASALRTSAVRWGLQDVVRLQGFLDFETGLVPRVSQSADLFVCCHRQGDPSCTYLETMSCGIPIVGYDNEAFHGILALSGAGWEVKMDDPRLIAETIATLSQHRERIAQASHAARRFGAAHPFEATFRRRIDHLLECSDSHADATTSLTARPRCNSYSFLIVIHGRCEAELRNGFSIW
jgi:glycosyltransferase involved in cell wall biosynthesis